MKINITFFGHKLTPDFIPYLRALLLESLVLGSYSIMGPANFVFPSIKEARDRSFHLLQSLEEGKYIPWDSDTADTDGAGEDIIIGASDYLSQQDKMHLWGVIELRNRLSSTALLTEYTKQPYGQLQKYQERLMEMLGDRKYPCEIEDDLPDE